MLTPPHSLAIAGLDEAGRGPWAGPLTAAVVFFSGIVRIPGLKDSKQLSAVERERLFEIILKKGSCGIGWVTPQEIDHFGLTEATAKAFRRALRQLSRRPETLQVDGKARYRLPYPAEYIVKGDQKVRCISAASILAKVARDRWMREQAQHWPQYGFDQHKGYGTALHQQRLHQHGVSTLHRRSYAPITALIV